MRRSHLLILMALSCTLVQAEVKTGATMHGFKLIEQRFVKEVDAECYLFEHQKSGARLFKISNADQNKTFCVSFKTLTESDAGTPHIMEHSVLNGSRNFPVKSPFDILAKGSLNTFLNAMTGSDITLYPVSSMNDKDFRTLMHIYLDAVFNPLIYDDPRILEQEGWHHELTHPDSTVDYKGVVYNEMKGAFSSPTREWGYWVDKNLFPDTPYRFSSGGYPKAIPTLTHEAFLAFHQKYYHPSNSYIFLYGDGDLDAELKFIDAEYLSTYSASPEKIVMPLQSAFESLRTAEGNYSSTSGSSTEGESYLSLSFVAGPSSDQQLVMGLRLIAQVLFNNESAPVRLALQEAGIGKDVSAFIDDLQQNVFHIRIQNANPEDLESFKKIVFETLKKTVSNGVDKDAVAGSLNRMEFSLREGNTPQKGIYYNGRALSSWFWTDNPFDGLAYEKPLRDLKTGLANRYLENLISVHFLRNNHALLFALYPKPGLETENDQAQEAELADYKTGLSSVELNALVQHTEDLKAHQKEEDRPEALASIPLLDLKDIKREVDWYEAEALETAGIPFLFYETFTNDISYLKFFFDLRVLSEEQLPYAQLLAVLLGSIGTEKHSFGELDNTLDQKLGGFNTYLTSYLEDQNDDKLIPKFVVSTKALSVEQSNAFDLSEEILNHSLLNDTERIHDVLLRHHSRLAANVKRDGLGYARTRLFSYFSNEGVFEEKTGGLDYFWFITDQIENFDANKDDLVKNLHAIQTVLFKRDNLLASLTADRQALRGYKRGLKKMKRHLSKEPTAYQTWNFSQTQKNEGLLAASKVQYVLQGADFSDLGYEWNGSIRVLNQIVSREWLTTQVRVIGGAYGGFARFNPNGKVYFGSYRDPNLRETFENFAATPGFLREFNGNETEMTRFIIGTISNMDDPLTASQRGNVAVSRYFQNDTQLKLQAERDEVLSTSLSDIKTYEKMVSDILANSSICVYGNEDKLKENKELFQDLISLE